MRKPLHKDGSWLFWHRGFGFLWTPKLIGVGLFGRTFNHRRNPGCQRPLSSNPDTEWSRP